MIKDGRRQAARACFNWFIALAFILQIAFPGLARPQIESKDDLDKAYDQALIYSQKHREEKAIELLEEIRQTQAYKQADNTFKRKACSLEMRCYDNIIVNEAFEAGFKKLVKEIVGIDREFDFESVLKKDRLLELVDEVKAKPAEQEQRTPQYFQFNTLKPQKVRAGEQNEIVISTSPDNVPVVFSLEDESERLFFKPGSLEDTRAILIYIPDSTQIGTTQSIMVRGTAEDVVRLQEITMKITGKGGIPGWAYYAGGGAAALGLIIMLVGGGDGNGGSSLLPDPPDHP